MTGAGPHAVEPRRRAEAGQNLPSEPYSNGAASAADARGMWATCVREPAEMGPALALQSSWWDGR